MSTTHHTAIATGAAANAAIVNSPLGALDDALGALSDGEIAYWDAGNSQFAGESELTWDDSTNSFKLISSTADVTARLEAGSTFDSIILLTETGNSGFEIKNNGTSNRLEIGSGNSGSFTNRLTMLRDNGYIGIGNVVAPGSLIEINFATEDLEFVNAGSASATEQDWIEVQVGGVTGYIRVYASK